jgi:hypothetical protein
MDKNTPGYRLSRDRQNSILELAMPDIIEVMMKFFYIICKRTPLAPRGEFYP